MRTILLIVAVVAVSTACAGSNSVLSDFRFGPDSSQALLVGSLTYDSSTGLYSVAASSRDGGLVGARIGFSQWPPLGPQFDDALQKKGSTFAIAVPPGQYTLQRWEIRQGKMIYAAPKPIGLAFKAEAGKVTYLGNFHFDADGSVTLEDRAARDLPILRSRMVAAGLAAPAYSIAAGTRLEHIGESAAAMGDSHVYVPAASASH